MLMLWLFWLETLAFIGFMFWAVLVQRPSTVALTGYHKAALLVYGIALLYCLYGFSGFARRRLAARTA
ncbi:MAG: hypothetical protein HYR56_06275 [Acidobacteria bacterium]|nr:hypothetical protein [Acidobacteriota bacterium]MBI3422258.1 hypothetical protein [Acidobacteriota bacterium]